jgi:hypothetical protein
MTDKKADETEAPDYSKMNIYQKMSVVTGAVGNVAKGDALVNKQYRFTSHDAVMAAVRPHLVEVGLVVLPTVTNRVQDGNRTEVDLSIAIINCDSPDQRVELNYFGYGIDGQDKGPGKAISYAVKYALLKSFSLDTGDDPENDANTEHVPAPKADVFDHRIATSNIIAKLGEAPHKSAFDAYLKEKGWLGASADGWILDPTSDLGKIEAASEKTLAFLIGKAGEIEAAFEIDTSPAPRI